MVLFLTRAAPSSDSLDFHGLRSVRLQALPDSPDAFSSSYERELARTHEDWRRWMAPAVTFLLECNDEPRGLVAGVRDQHDLEVVHLMAMWVHPDFRGIGAADLLVQSVKAWALEVGAAQVRLQVVESNARARRCYERAGFRRTGRQGVVERTGAVEIEMACEGRWLLGTKPGASSGERAQDGTS